MKQKHLSTVLQLSLVVWLFAILRAAGEDLRVPLQWTYQHPLPQNGTLNDVVFGGGLYVAVGGAILTSADSVTWTNRQSNSQMTLQGIAYGNGLFVAAGGGWDSFEGRYKNAIATSSDGVNWNTIQPNWNYEVHDVAFGNGQFAIVGGHYSSGAKVLVSTNGTFWTETSAPGQTLNSVIFDGTRFIAVGDQGTWLVSTNPASGIWQQQTISSFDLAKAAVGNGRFLVYAQQYVSDPGYWQYQLLWSTNGLEWQTQPSDYLSGIAFQQSRFFVMQGGGGMRVSTNALDWTQVPSVECDLFFGMVSYGSYLVAVGVGGVIATSSDGQVWIKRTTGMEYHLQGVACGLGRFVAVGYNYCGSQSPWSYAILSSEDATNWTTHVTGADGYLKGVAFGNGTFVVLGGGTVLTSTNGTAWLQQPSLSANLIDVRFLNGIFVAVGTAGDVYSSSNGISWTLRETGVSDQLHDITYGAGRYIAVGAYGAILCSSNLVTWEPHNFDTNHWLYGICYGNSRFVAVGHQFGPILVSQDGDLWSAVPSIVDYYNLNAVTFAEGVFTAVATSGRIICSPDGTNWIEATSGTPQGLEGVAYGHGLYVAVGGSGTVITAVPMDNGFAPTITEQPADLTVHAGYIGVLHVTASASGILRYQWQKDGTSIPGAQSATLVIPNVQTNDAATYRAIVASLVGTNTSLPATLTVLALTNTHVIRVPQDCATIQQGLNAAQWGDSVMVSPGNYHETIALKPGVSLLGAGYTNTVIGGTNIGAVVGADDASISGFTINGCGISAGASTMTIRGNSITNCWTGVLASGIAVIEDNLIVGNAGLAGIFVNGGTALVRNNTIAQNYRGLEVCTFGSVPSVEAVNNIIWGNDYGVAVFDDVPVSLSHNDVYGNYLDFSGLPAQSPSDQNISVNPRFVDSTNGDYRLTDSSRCIGVGLNLPDLPNLDLDGKRRINPPGSNPDLGAFENVLAVPLPNNAPFLAEPAEVWLPAIDENGFNNWGTTVQALIASLGTNAVTDADGDAVGMAITAVNESNGVWQYLSPDDYDWTDIGPVAETSARLLTPESGIRFVPTRDFFGTVSPGLSFRAWDQTIGNEGGLVDVTGNAGSSAFSAAVGVASTYVDFFPPPPNDNFADRIVLSGASLTTWGSTVGATAEPGEPNHDYYYAPGTSVWWSWSPPTNGTYVIEAVGENLLGAYLYGIVAVYSGSGISNLVSLAEDSLDGPVNNGVLCIQALAGTEYVIVVDAANWPGPLPPGSENVVLTISPGEPGPRLLVEPLDQTLFAGESLYLSTKAVGVEPLGYQWRANGTNIIGATDAYYYKWPVETQDAGRYSVLVTNAFGAVTSRAAQITILPAPQTNLIFPDQHLEAAIRMTLGKTNGPITSFDMQSMTHLYASYRHITNLTGLEWATSLSSLNLSGNSISNVSVLGGLTSLTSLDLSGNPIGEYGPLALLANLTSLYIGNTSLTNVEWLSDLSQLRGLGLWSDHIADLTPLAGLTNLTWVDLGGTGITNVSALTGLPGLTTLILNNDGISDPATVIGLTSLTNLLELNLGGNLLTNWAPVAAMTNLASLYLDYTGITNLSCLSSLGQLSSLSLDGNGIADLAPLASLTNLVILYVDENPLTNCAPLAGLTNLNALCLDYTGVSDLSCLAGLSQLTLLSAVGDRISDLVPLQTLTNLQYLYLYDNRLTNITPLQHLPNLMEIYLNYNLLDLSPGSAAMDVINSLVARNVTVYYLQQDEPPSVEVQSRWTIAENSLSLLDFYVYDDATPGEDLVVTATSSNSGLVSDASLVITESNGNFTLSVTPTLNQTGTTTITLTVIDGAGLMSSVGIQVTVLAVEEVVFADPNLETAVRSELGRPTGSLTTMDMQELTYLGASYQNITNLSGLEWALSLTSLDLSGNAIADWSPLSGLIGLTGLYLTDACLADVGCLAGLRNLEYLDLENNRLSDLNALGALTNLQYVYVRYNRLTNITTLRDLPNLTEIYLDYNLLDLTPESAAMNVISNLLARDVAVHYLPQDEPPTIELQPPWTIVGNSRCLNLYVYDDLTASEDLVVTAVSSNTGLVPSANLLVIGTNDYRTLTVTPTLNQTGTTKITLTATDSAGQMARVRIVMTVLASVAFPDPHLEAAIRDALDKPTGELTPLDLQELTYLEAGQRGITNLAGLEWAMNLTSLSLGENSISNLSQLGCLMFLEDLDLILNRVGDPTPLLDLPDLQSLDLGWNPIRNWDALCGLAGLRSLNLGGASVTNAECLSCLTNLRSLSLRANHIADPTPLWTLANLTWLDLSYNPVTNLSALCGFTHLGALTLEGNSMTDATFLQCLTQVTTLHIGWNQLGDLNALSGLTNLNSIDASYNRLTNIDALVNLPNLQWVDLYGNLLDLTPGSAASTIIQALRARGVNVHYDPQNEPPVISLPDTWTIPANEASSLSLDVWDDATVESRLVLTAHSSNQSLIPDGGVVVQWTSVWPRWKLSLTPTLNQTGTTTVTLTATDDTGLSAGASFIVSVLMPSPFDGQAVNNSNLGWRTLGASPWVAQTNTSHDGLCAAQSGSSESWLEARVTGPGTLSFWWKSSSTNDGTSGQVTGTCDGSGLSGSASLSGGGVWRQETLGLPLGSWVIRWQPVRLDESAPTTLWVDEVSFLPGPPPCWLKAEREPEYSGVRLSLHGELGAEYDLEVSTNLLQWSPLGRVQLYDFQVPYHEYATFPARFYRLHRVVPAASIWLEAPSRTLSGPIQLILHSDPGLRFEMQVSTNLTIWNPLATITNSLGSVQYTDAPATNHAHRFYRAKLVPY